MTRRYGNTPPTKAQHRTALTSMLILRRTLEGIDRQVESLARTHGLPIHEVAAAVEAERVRRAGV